MPTVRDAQEQCRDILSRGGNFINFDYLNGDGGGEGEGDRGEIGERMGIEVIRGEAESGDDRLYGKEGEEKEERERGEEGGGAVGVGVVEEEEEGIGRGEKLFNLLFTQTPPTDDGLDPMERSMRTLWMKDSYDDGSIDLDGDKGGIERYAAW